MNAKDLVEWLEDQGELVVSKADGGNFIVMIRRGGILKTAEAPTLVEAVMLMEEM